MSNSKFKDKSLAMINMMKNRAIELFSIEDVVNKKSKSCKLGPDSVINKVNIGTNDMFGNNLKNFRIAN